jgi:hypothetical protein
MKDEELFKWAERHGLDHFASDLRVMVEDALELFGTSAQPEQEPVGRFAKFTDGIWREVTDGSPGIPLYTSPPQRPWVGLTDEDIFCVLNELQAIYNGPPTTDTRVIFARAIEAKLRSKNT